MTGTGMDSGTEHGSGTCPHAGADPAVPSHRDLAELRELKTELTRFMLAYKFATDEMMTKINILKEEFASIHDYSPIEHVASRLKSPEGILKKAVRKGCPLLLDDIRAQIQDIAGIRITCSFISDTYRILDMLTSQLDVTVLEVKDYIAAPKPNGYKSLHLIVDIPVFMSDRVDEVTVEIQIRTVAMDFWASLEHKIYYKYRGAVPVDLVADLKQAADVANRLDLKMEGLHDQVLAMEPDGRRETDLLEIAGLSQLALPEGLLAAIGRTRAAASAAASAPVDAPEDETGPEAEAAG
ncbi:MAG TPA: GTP pyrophosphokinase family protein [Cryobacterium sp.]|nr:GTP pyrophosphokinase family protein [Cryobacterium sp.]